jgi:hypothetical protein
MDGGLAMPDVSGSPFIDAVVSDMDSKIAELEELTARLRGARSFLTGEVPVPADLFRSTVAEAPPEPPPPPPPAPPPAPPPPADEEDEEEDEDAPVEEPPPPPPPPPADLTREREQRRTTSGTAKRSSRSLDQMYAERKAAAEAERERRKPIIRRWIEEQGIFTGKRLQEAMKEAVGAKLSNGELLSIAEMEVGKDVHRHGGQRGPGVYFTHKDYTGPTDLTTARGGVSFGETQRQAKRQRGTSKEAADSSAASPPARAPARRRTPEAPPPYQPTKEKVLRWIEQFHSDDMFVTRAVSQQFAKSIPWCEGVLNELAAEGKLVRHPHSQWKFTGEREPVLLPEDAPTESQVRDLIVSLGTGSYSPHSIITKAKQQDVKGSKLWDVVTVRGRMKELCRQGILVDESIGDEMVLYGYRKPSDPGAAAKLDMQRREQERAAPSGPGADAVPGTGKGLVITNQDVRALAAAAMAKGAKVARATNSHYEVSYDGKKVLISSTPRNKRSVENDRTRIRRRLGIAV